MKITMILMVRIFSALTILAVGIATISETDVFSQLHSGVRETHNARAPLSFLKAPPQGFTLYTDPRIRAWAKAYLAGDRKAVITAVEVDLKSAAPHPFAPHVWTVTTFGLGHLKETWAGMKDETLRRSLGVLPDILLLYSAGEYRKLLDAYPPTKAAEIKDSWALHYLAFAAYDEARPNDMFIYATARARLDGDSFHAAWATFNAAEGDERVRVKVEALVAPGGEFAGTLFGALMRDMRVRPLTEAVMLAASESWLAKSPTDAFALRFKSIHLDKEGQTEAAAKATAEAASLYPFGHTNLMYWRDHAPLLIKLNRMNEARELVKQSAALRSRDEREAEPLAELEMVQALRDANKTDQARALLEAANERSEWHGQADLMAERAQLELEARRPRVARHFAENAVALKRDKVDYWLLLIETHQELKDYAAALTAFENGSRELTQKSQNWYWRGSQILLELQRHRERVNVCERGVAEYPNSPLLLRETADALDKVGLTTEAIATARTALEIAVPSTKNATQLADLLKKTEGRTGAVAELERLTRRYAWNYAQIKSSPANMVKSPTGLEPVGRCLAKTASDNNRVRLVTQLGHTETVTVASYSPDNCFVLTASSDGTAIIWDTGTGRELRRFEDHMAAINAAVFSPTGTLVATGSSDGSVLVWEVLTGKVTERINLLPAIRGLAFDNTGKRLAIVGAGSRIHVWNLLERRVSPVEYSTVTGRSLNSVQFSPDGNLVVATAAGSAYLWSVETGKQLSRYSGHGGDVVTAAMSADARFVVTAGADRTARLWHTATGVELQRFEGHKSAVQSVALSTDGQTLITGSRDRTVRWWNIESGKEMRPALDKTGGQITSVAFSSAGDNVLTGSSDHTARIWESDGGTERATFAGRSSSVAATHFAPNNRMLLIGTENLSARLWDLASGTVITAPKDVTGVVNVLAFKPDSRTAITASVATDATGDDTSTILHLWDTETGKPESSFVVGRRKEIRDLRVSPDARYLVVVRQNGGARLWDIERRKEIQDFGGFVELVNSVAFASDSRSIVLASDDKTLRVWDVASGRSLSRLVGHTAEVWAVAFTPDNRSVLTGSADRTARLWDATTGQEIKRFGPHEGTVVTVAISSDGKHIATGGANTPARLWDIGTGLSIRTFGISNPVVSETGSISVSSMVFSSDGKYLVTGSLARTSHLWEVATGKELQRLEGTPDVSRSTAFTPDSQRLAVAGKDGAVRVFTTADGNLLCRLISFLDGTWAAVDKFNRFDAANGGDVRGLHLVIGNEPFALTQLKDRYYEPYLLTKLFGFDNNPPRDVKGLEAGVLLPPGIEYQAPTGNSTSITLKLTNRGGGLGRVRVLVNGNEVATVGARANPQADRAELPIDLAEVPNVIPGKANTIEVIAWSADGNLSTASAKVIWRPAPLRDTIQEPELYAIIAGISTYSNPQLNLSFAAKDAENVAAALSVGANRLFPGRVHITLLTTPNEGAHSLSQPTRLISSEGNVATIRRLDPVKANFRLAFDEVEKRAKPNDILFIYLAGHGTAVPRIVLTQPADGEGGEIYCYPTREAGALDDQMLADAVRRERVINSDELTDWIKKIPANKRAMVLDTCAAGAFGEQIAKAREDPADRIRAIERMQDRTGFYILMGSARDAKSYEASRYRQGLLTYALLKGLKGADRSALRDDEFADVGRLFLYARDQVPELARGVGGIQQPRIATPAQTQNSTFTDTFDIGQFSAAEKASIVLSEPVPFILRPRLMNLTQGFDNLMLEPALRRALRELNYADTRGDLKKNDLKPTGVYIDADEMPGAVLLSGIYTADAQGRILATLKVVEYGQENPLSSYTVEGTRDNSKSLIFEIMRRLYAELEKIPKANPTSKKATSVND